MLYNYFTPSNSFTMERQPRILCLTVFFITLFVTGYAQKKEKPYSLNINKGDFWVGGGLGLSGAIAPLGQYIGTAASLEIKGGYHIVDKFAVGITITAGISIADKKESGVYNRGINLLIGPIIQYTIPLTKTLYLVPTAAVTHGPINIKSMTSAAGQPEEYVKVKGNATCEIFGAGPFFEVIPHRASFGAHVVYSFVQQKTNVYANSGDEVPGSTIKDRKNGPGLIMEFKLHF
jgi:hypothetical protein